MAMFLKKRRDENLRVLTEREIQEKLYGHFRQKTVAVEEEEAVPAVQEPPQKTERDLFVPAAEPVEKKEPLYKPRPAPAAKKPNRFLKDIGGTVKKSFTSVANKVSAVSLPKVPTVKKPRWVEKLETLPLTSVAAAFFAAVLLVVGLRAVMHIGFNAWPVERILQAHKMAVPAGDVQEPDETPVEENIIIKVSETVASAPKVEVLKAPAPSPLKKYYTIQLVVYENVSLADKQVQRLKAKKLDAFHKSVKTSRGKERYQVFLGHFPTFDDAQSRLAKYKKANLLTEFSDSFVRPQTE